MTAADCIFCKIAVGDVPCLLISETPESLAFLDIGPLAGGHMLLIPKHHYENILDVPGDVLASMARQLPKLGGAVIRATGATGLNVLQNTGTSSGQAVFHLHFHLIPRRGGDGLGYRWNAGAYAEGQGKRMQSKILSELGG